MNDGRWRRPSLLALPQTPLAWPDQSGRSEPSEVRNAVLSNPKHELFAQARAKRDSVKVAYVKAGYKPDPANAQKLTRNHRVKAHILGWSARLQPRLA
jgi:hypothetical protein